MSRKTSGLRESALGMRKSRTVYKKSGFSGGMWHVLKCQRVRNKKGEALFSRRLVVKGVKIGALIERVRDSKKSFCDCFKVEKTKICL